MLMVSATSLAERQKYSHLISFPNQRPSNRDTYMFVESRFKSQDDCTIIGTEGQIRGQVELFIGNEFQFSDITSDADDWASVKSNAFQLSDQRGTFPANKRTDHCSMLLRDKPEDYSHVPFTRNNIVKQGMYSTRC